MDSPPSSDSVDLMKDAADAFTTGNCLEKSLRRDELEDILLEQGLDLDSPLIRSELAGALDPDDLVVVDVADRTNILTKAITRNLAVPNWKAFTGVIESIYDDIKANVHGGANASYIPVLEEQDSDWFGISVCTVDGQRFDIGDCDVDFSIQSCVKPLMYAVAIEDVGLERVHQHVGTEPSGLVFNEVSLNSDSLPHNPMVNPGAIATGSCVNPGADMSSRFRHFMDKVHDLTGGSGKLGFSQPTYLCEFETAWRNNALMYFMQEAGVFPADCDPEATLDFYIQCCSIEVNTSAAAGIAATLANGGISPLTGIECLATSTVKSVLTLMFNCGMYDYSGEWCVHVGLPAKSGVAGLVYVVVPHVMGIAVFSPPLDSHGNSVRAVEFYKRLLLHFPYGIFDSLTEKTSSGGDDDASKADGASLMDSPQSADTSTRRKARLVIMLKARRVLRKLGRLHRALKGVAKNYCVGGRAYNAEIESAFRSILSENLSVDMTSSPAASARRSPVGGSILTSTKSSGAKFTKGMSTRETPASPPDRLKELFCPIAALRHFLAHKGISSSPKGSDITSTSLERLQSLRGFVCVKDIVDEGANTGGLPLVAKALLGELVMPDFKRFAKNMKETYHVAENVPLPRSNALTRVQQEINTAFGGQNSFAVAVCTVDGQQMQYGTATRNMPLMEVIKPLIYALALKDCGTEETHKWVASEPTAFPVDSFELKKVEAASAEVAKTSLEDSKLPESARTEASAPKGEGHGSSDPSKLVPYNPFMTSGSLVLCSLLGKGFGGKPQFHDTSSKFKHVMETLAACAGGGKVGFNNPTFLAMKQRGLKPLAISHFIKGMGCYPPATLPEDNALLYFQCCAAETSLEDMAVVAATLANVGKCPLTGVECFQPAIIKSLLSRIYSSGLNTYTGKWAFSVGIPAVASSNGLLMIIIPNVMGCVIYQPTVNKDGLSPAAVSLCRQLTHNYRVNLFDQLVYQDQDIIVDNREDDKVKESPETAMLRWFELCYACSAGDVDKVKQLIEQGVDVTHADYDKRTALHIAASDGKLEVAKLLIRAGADPTKDDRWGHTPIDDAEAHGHVDIVAMMKLPPEPLVESLDRQRKLSAGGSDKVLLKRPLPPITSKEGKSRSNGAGRPTSRA